MPRPERMLDPAGGALEQFADDLRRLREKAGRPGYRLLAQRAHFSASVLSEAAGGRKLPTLAVTLAFVSACGGDPAEWEARWRAVSEELAGPGAATHPGGRAPYQGLAPYQQQDADWFFGRTALLAEVLRRLALGRFLAVFGASGSGKSSLLMAGLLPAAERGALPAGAAVRTLVMTPGPAPVAELAQRLAPVVELPAGTLLADLRAAPDRLHQVVDRALSGSDPGGELLIVVDQFEEVFGRCGDPAERSLFIDALVAAATAHSGRVRVVLGVRADFYPRCAEHPCLVAALREGHLLVGAMTAPELREVITGPAQRAGLTVEADLVSVIVAEATGRPGALPLVSHALLETWRRRRGIAVTLAGYRAAGGLDGAIAQTAESVYRGLDEPARRVARRILLRLVDLGDGSALTRRRVDVAEFDRDDPATSALLRRLADARLVTLGEHTVDLAHEALIRAWPRLATWIDEDRDSLRVHREVIAATAIWQEHQREAGTLYRGARLLAAQEWVQRHADLPTPREREFLDASLAAERGEARARSRRVRAVVAGLVAVALVTSGLAGWALHETRQARDQRNVALSRQLAAEARDQLDVDPESAVLLAEQAWAVRHTREAEAVLRQAVADSRIRGVVRGYDGPVYAVGYDADGTRLVTADEDGTVRIGSPEGPATVYKGHQGRVWGAALSRDGRALATGGEDRTVRLWDRADPSRSTILGKHDGTVRNVVFSPDGRQVVSVSDDGTVRVWDVTGRTAPIVLHGHDGPALGVAYSPDGKLLATGGNDQTVRLWSTVDWRQARVLRGHEASVEYVVFSADGKRVASASTDGTARVWPVDGAGDPLVLRGHDGTVEAVALSPDGQQVATAGNDRTVRLWSTTSEVHPRILRGHNGTVWAVAFSPDSRRLASASDDGTVRLWDPGLTGDPTVLRGHDGSVWSAVFSANGRYAASAGRDRTVRVWDTATGAAPVVLRGSGDEVAAVDIGRDGRLVVGGSIDGMVRIWDQFGTDPPVVLDGRGGAVMQVALSPDGRSCAAGYEDGTIRIWPVTGRGDPVVLRGHQGQTRIAYSPDGTRLVSAGWDGTVRLWPLAGGDPIVLRGHEGPVWSATFSPDGRQVVSAGSDGTVRVWRADGTGQPTVLGSHQGVAWTASFTPDGRQVVSAGSDGTVRIWRADGVGEPVVFSGFGASVESAAVSAADDRLVTAHGDGTVRVWRCPVCGPIGQVLAEAGTHVTRALTADERRLFQVPAG